ncbi:MAG: FbiC1 [Candidatus Magnetoglobus multicellularis str. Araruama]|uniref:Cyclic dehypoxanthine futalosine synthase n=1 Tax=Candidatus Magnetoglobus multicellularis str. Araruama TaxID=890399 RepID=A0A1V1PB41_9BACT|nr:MAG: FbiC1 [Candidatus Magnetoglobus multicellularis str. Araruama]
MNNVESIIDAVFQGERIQTDAAEILYHNAPLLTLANLADQIRYKKHPNPVVTFVVDRNINYTNVCISRCKFCAFCRPLDHQEAYVISRKELDHKIQETIDLGGTQILMQGGLHPDLPFSFYVDLLEHIKSHFDIHIHGFSPPEIDHMARISGLTVQKTIQTLKKAGLDSIPGGGAEILVDTVRCHVSPNKCNTSTWLEIMKTAHDEGLPTSATMMFGHIETPAQMIAHLMQIRELQDHTSGFTAFIPWSFQPKNTHIYLRKSTAWQYLRVLALSRIILDNVPNIQASWVTQGDKVGQLALTFGANDLGSTMIEENVVSAAGVKFRLSKEDMIRLIQSAGLQAAQRNCVYEVLHWL